MSNSDQFFKGALGVSQGLFGEDATYSQGETEVELKAVFQTVDLEINGLVTQGLSAEIIQSDLNGVVPSKGDTLTQGDATYRVDQARLLDGVYTLILKEQ